MKQAEHILQGLADWAIKAHLDSPLRPVGVSDNSFDLRCERPIGGDEPVPLGFKPCGDFDGLCIGNGVALFLL